MSPLLAAARRLRCAAASQPATAPPLPFDRSDVINPSTAGPCIPPASRPATAHVFSRPHHQAGHGHPRLHAQVGFGDLRAQPRGGEDALDIGPRVSVPAVKFQPVVDAFRGPDGVLEREDQTSRPARNAPAAAVTTGSRSPK